MQRSSIKRPVRVGLISLGCAKNLVDAEIMLGTLLKAGIEIVNDAPQADVVIVNTCSFIDAAQEESVDAILESAEVREATHRGQALVVSGCLPQRFGEELPKLLPEVDAFMGIDQVPQAAEVVTRALARRSERLAAGAKAKAPTAKSGRGRQALAERQPKPPNGARARLFEREPSASAQPVSSPSRPARANGEAAPVLEITRRPRYIPDYATPRFRLTPRHFAYLKIAEGCNHPCSFCIIPRMRGSHRSRSQADIVAEARALLDDGVKELNLISQDTTYYGLDRRPQASPSIASPAKFSAATRTLAADSPTLGTLLRELNALPGEFWIRLLYTHPAHWTDALIQTIAECPKVARYVDVPLQHIHDNMLQRMRRETSRQYIVDLIRRLRAGIPGVALRTTFIVGFPGETEACFDALLDFIREIRFERLGVFVYSREEGTVAGKMAHQIPDKIKQHRREVAMAAQHRIAREVAASAVGRTIRVLVEHPARTEELRAAQVRSWEHGWTREAGAGPGRIRGGYQVARGEADAPDIDGRVYVRGNLPAGAFAQVRVVGHTDYDLIAEPA